MSEVDDKQARDSWTSQASRKIRYETLIRNKLY